MTYLPSEFREPHATRGVTENSGADVRATTAMGRPLMKYSATIAFALMFSTAQADTTYRMVSDYLAAVTEGASKQYSCNASSQYSMGNSCKPSGPIRYPPTARIFGMVQNKEANTGHLFILKPTHDKLLQVEVESSPFALPEYPISVEDIASETNDRFQLIVSSGSPGSPEVNTYHFGLVAGAWRVTKLSRSELSSCGEEVSVNSEYSADYLSGMVLIDRYRPENCKRGLSKRYRLQFPVFPISQFVPFDEKYMPEPPRQ